MIFLKKDLNWLGCFGVWTKWLFYLLMSIYITYGGKMSNCEKNKPSNDNSQRYPPSDLQEKKATQIASCNYSVCY